MGDPSQAPGAETQPAPRMTSSHISISQEELSDLERFLAQRRAQKAMEAGGGNQDIAGITHEFMRRQLRLIRSRVAIIENLTMDKVLAILDEHIQALE